MNSSEKEKVKEKIKEGDSEVKTKKIKKIHYLQKQKKNGKAVFETKKTKKCQFYNKGACTKGQQCTFSHEFQPEAFKKICKFYLSGACSKGLQCLFSHNRKDYPCRFYHLAHICRAANNCEFSHLPLTPQNYQQLLKDNQDFIQDYQTNKHNQEKIARIGGLELTEQLNQQKISQYLPKNIKKENQTSQKVDPRIKLKKTKNDNKNQTKEIKAIKIYTKEELNEKCKKYFADYFSSFC